MRFTNTTIDILFILVGSVIAIYAKVDKEQNLYILIIGIVVLMFGLYRLSSKIPSKKNDDSMDKANDDLK